MIRVDDKYGIVTDDFNYSVVNHRVASKKKLKDGSESISYKTLAYYRTMGGALEKIIDLRTKDRLDDHDMDLREAVAIYREEVKRLESLLAGFN